jgi:hypothetical protein
MGLASRRSSSKKTNRLISAPAARAKNRVSEDRCAYHFTHVDACRG